MPVKKIAIFLSFFTFILLLFCGILTKSNYVSNIFHHDNLIIIDPGHGGNDPGKVGFQDILEKDLNLQIAKKLKKKLEKKKYNIKLTRSGDYNLSPQGKRQDLEKRKQLILSSEPSFVISIHQNSYPRGDIKGAQVFYYAGFEESKQLADCIQTSLKQKVDPSNTRVSKANSDYYLLRDNPYPTVIVECGFLSNLDECQKLSSSSYQHKIVMAVYEGILNYKKADQ
ncbi:MAG: N-acetylmuramoyl-L-alanine amidase [Anaerostipes sp.]|nr:N-acetylmuramoyl-L-alanine amidase [Anaerostipes sp.]